MPVCIKGQSECGAFFRMGLERILAIFSNADKFRNVGIGKWHHHWSSRAIPGFVLCLFMTPEPKRWFQGENNPTLGLCWVII